MPGRIDVHHHLILPDFTAAMAKRGITKVAGAELPASTPDKSLSRSCNDYAAGVAAKHPGRFGFFAVPPMPFTAESCAEAIYALDVLKADGIVLLGSTEGKFLGDPSLNELMAELHRRKATVFVHPNIHRTSTQIGLNFPEFFVEFLCDTTRAATNLTFSGTAELYPDIKWTFSHAGGFLPYVAWRLALADGILNLFPKYRQIAA